MSALSDLYQVQYSYGDFYKLGYNWGDDTHPSTYQSFTTSGKGTIDQSIFMFQRPNDAWSFGAYCTVITTGNSREDFHLTVSKNRLSKNNVAWFNGQLPYEDMYSQTTHRYIRECEYSPIQTMVGGLNPWIECAYNNYCLFPEFGLIDPNTGTTTPWVDYKTMMNSYSTYRVCNIRVTIYNGPPVGVANPLCVQFAGSLPDVTITNVQGGEYSVTIGDNTEGVFYISNGKIFDTPVIQATGNITNVGNATLATFFDITQMDYELVSLSTAGVLAISIADAVKIINRLGFYWSKDLDSVSNPKGINCTDSDLVCPVIDSTTHMVTDEVYEGTDIAQYARDHLDDPYCNYLLDYGNTDEQGNPIGLDNEDYRENFNPEQTTVEPTDEINLNTPVIASTGGNTLWIMSQEKLEEFFMFLWDPNGSIFDDIVHGAALLGENPMDSVVSLKLFPFDLTQVTTSEYRTMCFGRTEVDVTNTRALTSSNLVVFDLGSFFFNDAGMFNDFRDYEPYSDYSLYIPFCGVVPLQAVECINTTISIKMIVDLIVGCATAVIFTNGVPYMYVDGNIGIDLPVTGRNCAELARTVLAGALAGGGILGRSAMHAGSSILGGAGNVAGANISNAGYNFKEALNAATPSIGANGAIAVPKAGAGAGLAAWGAAGAAFGGLTAVGGVAVAGVIGAAPFVAGAAAAALTHNAPPQSAGCNAPATGLAKPLYPYFIVRRSDSWLPENYTKLYGRPLQEGGKVSDFAGFCTFGNINTDGLTDMTYEEKIQISELLQKGVII